MCVCVLVCRADDQAVLLFMGRDLELVTPVRARVAQTCQEWVHADK